MVILFLNEKLNKNKYHANNDMISLAEFIKII